MLDGLYFQQPYWLLSLLFPLWLYFFGRNTLIVPAFFQAAHIRYPALGLLGQGGSDSGTHTSLIRRPVLLSLFLALLIVSLAQPVIPGQALPTSQKPQALDLVLVVNTGVSMVLRDYVIEGEQIDRMQMARRLLIQLVDNFKGDRLALVILGRPPSLWLPLTTDRRVMKDAVSRLKTTLGGRSSDLGETLTLVNEQFPAALQKSGNQRMVLLVNDGYAQLGAMAPEVALEKLRENGFKLHTLAIGSNRTPEFSLGKGTLIYQPADLQLMNHLATLGGGEMLHAKDLSIIGSMLNMLDHSDSAVSVADEYRLIISLYHYPLTLALILLLYHLLSGSASTRTLSGER